MEYKVKARMLDGSKIEVTLDKPIIPCNLFHLTEVEEVIIGEEITTIHFEAFCNCCFLKKIEIPNSVNVILSGAFNSCEDLTAINLPNNIKKICHNTFAHCHQLKSIVLPTSVEKIEHEAFKCCYSLEKIIIPNSVTSIGSYAFSGCKSLTSIVIPNSVTYMGEKVFSEYDDFFVSLFRAPQEIENLDYSNLTIYCEAERQPSGWDKDWNYSGYTVIWGYKGDKRKKQ